MTASKPAATAASAFLDSAAEYALSIADPQGYWSDRARAELPWTVDFTRALTGSLAAGDVAWFAGGELNVCVACVDRHLDERGDRAAIIWEGDDPGRGRTLTYRELHAEVCRLANALARRGVAAGDGVGIYLPTIPEAAIAMLACARIGAIHCVVFAGFGAEALRQRLADARCRVVITADIAMRGGRTLALKAVVDEALRGLAEVHSVFVLRRATPAIALVAPRELCLRQAMDAESPVHEARSFASGQPLFVLHTSGSTGTPKAVTHAGAASLLWAMRTHRLALDWRDGDVYACVADVGWITGHSYVVYGPLGNGAATLMFEGIPTHPDPGRYWRLVARHRVAVLFTVPTAVRAIASRGDAYARAHDLSSLRVLATAGEALDATAWRWLHDVPGAGRSKVIDIYGQTEGAGHLLAARPSAYSDGDAKPGSVGSPLPGVAAVVLDEAGRELLGEAVGLLAIAAPWPGLAASIGSGIPDCLSRFPGFYLTGDACRRDADGHFWITGRTDDVVNVSGIRLGTVEIEAVMLAHPECAEAAVVGIPHAIKGSTLIAFAVMRDASRESGAAADALRAAIRAAIGAIAAPERVVIVPALPKTRSGKVIRRVLRALAMRDDGAVGDLSALADAAVLDAVRKACG